MAMARIGKSSWNRGGTSWVKGKRLTEVHKNKIGLANRKAILEGRLIMPRLMGENNPMWRGGITPFYEQIRNLREYQMWRTSIFIRDNFACRDCGISDTRLQADHIKPFALIIRINDIKTLDRARNCNELWDVNNGKTLCIPCNKKTPTYLNGTKLLLNSIR